MQLLHGMYNAQNYLEGSEVESIWKLICEHVGVTRKFKRLPAPVLTRWWYVGVAASLLLKNLDVWVPLMKAIRNNTSSGAALNDIASCNWSLAQEPMIISDLHLLSAFHEWFMFTHFKFLQGEEVESKRSGYLSRHMLE